MEKVMANCPKCNSSTFKVELVDPRGSNFKLNLVTCASCGSAVGVLDYWNIGALLKEQEKTLNQVLTRIASLEPSIQQIAHHLRNR